MLHSNLRQVQEKNLHLLMIYLIRSRFSKQILFICITFQELPYPTIRSYASSFPSASASVPHNADLIPLDISVPEMLQFIQNSSRSPQENDQIENTTYQEDVDNDKYSWLQFIASFGMLDMTRNAPNNFQREIRHLDTTTCREVHKVAVIYVGKDQQVQLEFFNFPLVIFRTSKSFCQIILAPMNSISLWMDLV